MKLVIGCLLLLGLTTVCYSTARRYTNFVIIGGTGDLARKYLWGSALQLFTNNFNENNTFSFYAGARVSQADGDKALLDILENVKCDDNDIQCKKMRPKFLENSRYVVLKYDDNYTKLCESFHSKMTYDVEVHQIFYLSIPSSAYQSVARNIHYNCRLDNVASTKIVLEKPFGHNKESAGKQADVIGQYFEDHEVHRVDHYLAKSVSKQILSFRATNREQLEDLLNSQYVDRVEIVMKERIGVKGRVDFYDQTGVVRDVMQNHLTELLALVAMDLQENVSESDMIERHKLHLLRRIRPVSKDALLLGQYSKYLEEATEELNNISQSYLTPTFAAALLQVNTLRWRGVPFILMSGKHMDERSSHVRILFREKEFCVSGCVDGNSTFTKYPRQLVFQLGHGPVPSAGILVSKSLFRPFWPVGMEELPMTSKDSAIHGQSPGDFHYAVPVKDIPAYNTVINDLYHNIHETFVTSARMLQLWDIWDTVIHETKYALPRLYKEYDAVNLNFTVDGYNLQYLEADVTNKYGSLDGQDKPHDLNMMVIPDTFRNNTLVCKPLEGLVTALTSHIFRAAEHAIKERGVFHIAFSGGKTPIILYEELVSDFPLFPWEHTHIWQVDERCVSQNDEKSNFLSIHEHLLKFINIPYFNIHPMPVSIAGKVCDKHNKGDKSYADLLNHLIPAQEFDLILLGLGTDGHTASLFANSKILEETSKLVSFVKSKNDKNIDRMSLLPPLINNSREIIVLVTGIEKHHVLHKISEIVGSNKDFPITYISPRSGHMLWYVDFEAWNGH